MPHFGCKVTKNRAKSKRKTRLSVAIPRWSNFKKLKVEKKHRRALLSGLLCPQVNIV